jgi:hypothetical protein
MATTQVFLSYAREDIAAVDRLYRGLTERGINVWFDQVHLKPGRWAKQIRREIARSRYFIICLSQAALSKTGDTPGFQDEELNEAYMIARDLQDGAFTIIPVRLEECQRGDHRTSIYQQYDLFPDWELEVDHLAVAIGGHALLDQSVTDERTESRKLTDAILGRVEAFYFAGDYERAVSAGKAALDFLRQEEAEFFTGNDLIAKVTGYDQATLRFREQEKLANAEAEFHRLNIEFLQGKGRYSQAKAEYYAVDHVYASIGAKLFVMGNKLAGEGRLDESIAAYDASIRMCPIKAPVVLTNKGIVLLWSDRVEAALQVFDKALDCRKPLPETWRYRAQALSRLNRTAEAEESLRKAGLVAGTEPEGAA